MLGGIVLFVSIFSYALCRKTNINHILVSILLYNLFLVNSHEQAFGWAYVNNWHNTWEQLYVYWICPFIGAMLAGWIFRAVVLPPAPKPKTKKA
jgi:hypothetical protein